MVSAVIGVLLNYLGAYFYGLSGVIIAGIVFPLIYLIWIILIIIFDKKRVDPDNEYTAH
jgi:O-antigen/teichoic acid export membrane protein